MPYGPPISLEQPKKVVAGAETEARKNNWKVVIAILDSGGNLVLLQRTDGTQLASIEVAPEKAHSEEAFRGRPRCSRTLSPKADHTCACCVLVLTAVKASILEKRI